MKPEGENLMEHLANKYGPSAVARFGQPGNPLDVAGSKVGITFRSDRRIVPTMDCHRAIEWCRHEYKDDDKVDLLMESMFKAYFSSGIDISKIDNIISLAQEVEGIDASKLKAALENKELFQKEVNEKIKTFQYGLNIRGVPYFILKAEGDDKPVTFSGAQPIDIIAEQLKLVHDEE